MEKNKNKNELLSEFSPKKIKNDSINFLTQISHGFDKESRLSVAVLEGGLYLCTISRALEGFVFGGFIFGGFVFGGGGLFKGGKYGGLSSLPTPNTVIQGPL